MPRARSPNRDKAKELWLASGKKRLLKDIAAELGVPENRIRKWKSEDKWEDEKASDSKGAKRNAKKGNVPKRKRGGQPGNKNAVGNNGGAPIGNQNAFKHGCYSTKLLETLDEDEKEILENGTQDVEALLMEQINVFSLREYRFMKAIQHYKNIEGGLAVSEVITSEAKRKFRNSEDEALYNEMITDMVKSGDRLPGNPFDITTKTEAAYSIIQSLERNLTEIQARKTKCIDSLAKVRAENQSRKTNDGLLGEFNAIIKETLTGKKELTDDGESETFDAQSDK